MISEKVGLILEYITRRNRGKPLAAPTPTPTQAAKLSRIAAARSAPSGQASQVGRIADAVELARALQVELARRFTSPAAASPAAAVAPTKRADEPAAEPVIAQPTPTIAKPLAPQIVPSYPIRGYHEIEMTAAQLLAKYNSLHGSEGLEFFRLHEREILAARAGVRLDAGRFPELSGTDRTIAALQRQFPARP